jgi:hypothetical protein
VVWKGGIKKDRGKGKDEVGLIPSLVRTFINNIKSTLYKNGSEEISTALTHPISTDIKELRLH